MAKRPNISELFTKSSKQKTQSNGPKQNQRRNKLFNSRQIRTSNNDPSFKEGILDIPSFLKSREFEIQQLEKAQLRSKYSASTRCFQSLPRVLRRRTASHNVKRVPKRMRKRAIREMKVNDAANNATTVEKKSRSKGRELYKLKMTKKLLRIASRLKLDKFGRDKTHSLADYNLRNKIKKITSQIKQYETDNLKEKLSKSCSIEETKLIKSRIQLNNIIGSYDNVGLNRLLPKPRGNAKYHKRQKRFVWLPTHIWHTKRAHLVKKWGFQIPLKPTQKCFRSTHRKSISDGALIWDTSYIGTIILESCDKLKLNQLIQKITNGKVKSSLIKAWNGFIYVEKTENLTKQIFGIATLIPIRLDDDSKVTNKIMIRLHPSVYEEYFQYLMSIKDEEIVLNDCRYSLGSIRFSGPLSLSALNQVISASDVGSNLQTASLITKVSSLQDLNSFSVGTIMSIFSDDPRLISKPIKTNLTKFFNKGNFDPIDLIISISKGEAINKESLAAITSFDGRLKSYENQPTIKQLASRRSKLLPGNNKLTKSTTDPIIPLIIVKDDPLSYSMIIPWFWVLPFWIQLNKVSHVSIGGLKQVQQLKFELGELNYPTDYPFLTSGFVENFINGDELFKKWNRIQSGKRINYEKLDLMNNDEVYGKGEVGSPFNCDWNFLRLLRFGVNKISKSDDAVPDTTLKFDVSNWTPEFKRELLNLNDVYEFIKDSKSLEKEKLSNGEMVLTNPIQLFSKSTYESSSSSLHEFLLKVVPINLKLCNKGHPKENARIYAIPHSDLSHWLLMKNNKKCNNKIDYNDDGNVLSCPHANYLIGFITSGTFNLSKGCGTGVGYIDERFIKEKYLLVRNVGESKARIAQFNIIEMS